MHRLACFLSLALALGACDQGALPERSNPYDPAFEGVRLVNAPDSLRLADASSTSVRLAWPDASSFESGYRLESAAWDAPVDLPPNTTSYRLDGLLDAGQRTLTVRTIGDAGGVSNPTTALTVAYPSLPGAPLSPRPDCRRSAALVVERDQLYCTASGGAAVAVYDLRFGTDGVGEQQARYEEYDRVVGRLASGEAVLASQAEAPRRIYAVVDGAETVRAGAVTSPGGPFIGPMAASPDGTRLAALYAVDAGTDDEAGTLAVYDLATGALLASGVGGPIPSVRNARLHMLTDVGTLVYTADFFEVVGWSLPEGAEAWTQRAEVDGTPFDPAGRQLFVRTATGAPVVLDADTGVVRGTVGGVLLEALPRGEFLVGVGDDGVTVWDVATGARVRSIRAFDTVLAAAFDGDTLVYIAGGRVGRLLLRAAWERIG